GLATREHQDGKCDYKKTRRRNMFHSARIRVFVWYINGVDSKLPPPDALTFFPSKFRQLPLSRNRDRFVRVNERADFDRTANPYQKQPVAIPQSILASTAPSTAANAAS